MLLLNEARESCALRIKPLDVERLYAASGVARDIWEMQREKSIVRTQKEWWYGGKSDFSFLCWTYKPQAYLFELVVFLKKFVLAGVCESSDPSHRRKSGKHIWFTVSSSRHSDLVLDVLQWSLPNRGASPNFI